MANDFNSVLATCKRFQDIATWDPEHFNANGALARIAELHKHELAEKDALIKELADMLNKMINIKSSCAECCVPSYACSMGCVRNDVEELVAKAREVCHV